MRTVDKIKDIIKKKGGHPSSTNRVKDQLDCLCDCTPSTINPEISLKEFVEGTLEEFKSDYVKTIGAYSFRNLTTLKTVVLSSVTSIKTYAFASTSLDKLIISTPKMCALETKYALDATPIAKGTGYIYVPAELVETYKSDTVWSNYANQIRPIVYTEQVIAGSLLELSDTTAESIRASAFQYGNLEKIEMTNVKTVNSNGIYEMPNLKEISLPELLTVKNSGITRCPNVKSINFPKLQTIENQGFSMMKGLKQIDTSNLDSIGRYAFTTCLVLKVLILRKSTVCTLQNTDAFHNTPFANGGIGGVVLVPSALVETYKTATNWSTLYGYGTCEFLPLEEYTVDGTTTGEIDWDKLNGREAAAAE